MMKLKIWQLYFLKQFIRMFFLFLICFYGLYVVIDYASRTSIIARHQIHVQWLDWVRYYTFVFASRAEILLPLALLIAFVHTVCSLNAHQELVALLASGHDLRVLMRPFLAVGLFFVLLMYANEQFLLPEALKKLRRIEDGTKHLKRRHVPDIAVRQVILEDGSLLIFQDYDIAKQQFFDVYWVQSIDSIYRMKYLTSSVNPKGYFVDHMIRQTNGELLQQIAYPELSFPAIVFNSESLQTTIIEPDIFPLMELAQQAFDISLKPNEKESKILTSFYWKLALPWLCIMAIMAPAPYCTRFSRHLPIFLIYLCSLFGLIAFYMFMDAAQVVARRQVLTPFWAIVAPFFTVYLYFTWQYNKLDTH